MEPQQCRYNSAADNAKLGMIDEHDIFERFYFLQNVLMSNVQLDPAVIEITRIKKT